MPKKRKWWNYKNTPRLSADIIIIKENKILVLRRAIEPYKGKFEFPGGSVEYGELVEHAAVREAKEETGLKVKLKDILGVYSSPDRDPRFHAATIAFIATPISGKLKGSFEGQPKWYSIEKIKSFKFGFDHAKALKDFLKWRKNKGTFWSTK